MKKIILIILLIAVVAIVAYFIFGSKNISFNPAPETKTLPIVKLAGEFKRTDKNKLVIETIVTDEEDIPSTEQEFEETLVLIDKNTEIIKYLDEKKTDEQFINEQNVFQEKVNQHRVQEKSMVMLEAPNRYISRAIAKDDLMVGDMLIIIAEEENSTVIARKISVERRIELSVDNNMAIEGYRVEIQGKVEEVLSDFITINYKDGAENENTKNIQVTDKTEIVKMSKKTEEQFKQEQEQFKKTQLDGNNEKLKANISAPSWFEIVPMKLSDLNSGQDVIVKGIEKNDQSVVADRIELIIN